MSRWCTAEQMRRWNGLPVDSDDPNFEEDSSMEFFIDSAQIDVQKQISIYVRNESCTGSIDGSNTEFYVPYTPIFDTDFDSSLGTADVTIYGWGDTDDFITKTELDVSSIDYLEGRVVLSSAPSSTFEAIKADYRYSNYEIDFDQVSRATAYLAGYQYFMARYMEIPVNVRVGAQMYRMDSPATKAWNAYLNTVANITSKLITDKKIGSSSTKLRRP